MDARRKQRDRTSERYDVLKAHARGPPARDPGQAALAAGDPARGGGDVQRRRGAERRRLRPGGRLRAHGDEVGDPGQDRRGHAAAWRQGTYGICAECDAEIAEARLQGRCPSRRCAGSARSARRPRPRRARETPATLARGCTQAVGPALRAGRGETMSEKDDRAQPGLRVRRRDGGEPRRTSPRELAILPLRDTILFPHAILPLAVARESSVALVHDAVRERKVIGVVTQRDPAVDDPVESDLYRIGHAHPHPQDVQVPRRVAAPRRAGRAAVPPAAGHTSTGRS